MNLDNVDTIAESKLREIFKGFLREYMSPAFGALPKREIDILVFALLRDLELIEESATAYNLMTDLRVTRTKALQLLFEFEMRRTGGNSEKLNEEVRQVFKNLRYHKDQNWLIVEVENPLVQAHLRSIVQETKNISDSTFSPSLVKLSRDALVDVMDLILDKSTKEALRIALIKSGAVKDISVSGAIKAGLLHVAARFVGDGADIASEIASEKLQEFIGPLMEKGLDNASQFISDFIVKSPDL